MQEQVLRGAHGQVGHNKLVKMDYVKQPYVQQGIGKEDFARESMYKPYVEEKKLGKVIRNATITVDASRLRIVVSQDLFATVRNILIIKWYLASKF